MQTLSGMQRRSWLWVSFFDLCAILKSHTQLLSPGPLAAEVHVAPHGDDDGDGSASQLLASLSRARDVVRQQRAQGVSGPIAVTLAAGQYPVTAPLELTAIDSGTETGPVAGICV